MRGGLQFIEASREGVVRAFYPTKSFVSSQARKKGLNGILRSEGVPGALNEKRGLGDVAQGTHVPNRRQHTDSGERGNTRVGRPDRQADCTAKRTPDHARRPRGEPPGDIIERRPHAFALGQAVAVFALARAHATEVEAQRREPRGERGLGGAIDDLAAD